MIAYKAADPITSVPNHYCSLLLGKECDLYLEGLDQFSGWFYSSLLTAVALTGKAPYKVYHTVPVYSQKIIMRIKGTVSQKLTSMLLYIVRKLSL